MSKSGLEGRRRRLRQLFPQPGGNLPGQSFSLDPCDGGPQALVGVANAGQPQVEKVPGQSAGKALLPLLIGGASR